MKNRILAIILCCATLLGVVPYSDVIATSKQAAAQSQPAVNYGAVIGNTAVFNDNFPVPVSDDPQKVDNPFGTDCEQLSEAETSDDLLLVITNYYLGADGNLWYKVKAADGHTLPEKLLNHPWVYQDNVNAPTSASLIIHENGGNYRPNYGAAIGITSFHTGIKVLNITFYKCIVRIIEEHINILLFTC